MTTEEREEERRAMDKLLRKDDHPRTSRKRRSDNRQSRDLKDFDIGFHKVQSPHFFSTQSLADYIAD